MRTHTRATPHASWREVFRGVFHMGNVNKLTLEASDFPVKQSPQEAVLKVPKVVSIVTPITFAFVFSTLEVRHLQETRESSS